MARREKKQGAGYCRKCGNACIALLDGECHECRGQEHHDLCKEGGE